jgi:hypothetical protein
MNGSWNFNQSRVLLAIAKWGQSFSVTQSVIQYLSYLFVKLFSVEDKQNAIVHQAS